METGSDSGGVTIVIGIRFVIRALQAFYSAPVDEPALQIATPEDEVTLDALMKTSAEVLFPRFYGERQSASAVRYVAQIDHMLLEDHMRLAAHATVLLVDDVGKAMDYYRDRDDSHVYFACFKDAPPRPNRRRFRTTSSTCTSTRTMSTLCTTNSSSEARTSWAPDSYCVRHA